MALVVKDRVKESTTTTGTADFTLGGASSGFQTFAVIGNGNSTYYAIADQANGDWEVGIGTYSTTGPTLTRDTVLESSNSGSKVVFAAGTKEVFCTYPAERSVYLDTAGSAVTVLDIGTLGTSTANITTANITSGTVSTTPTSNNDIANKVYVDTIASSGITYHTPVKYEVPNTTGNLNATYNQPGGPGVGVGATLTNAGTLAAFAPDGPTASPGDRILVYNQTNQFENGVYTVTTVGNGSTAWVLTRATDADTYALKSPTGLGNGDAFFITSGNTGAGETYVCNTPGAITFGTTAITFAQISDATLYTAGTGLTLTGTEFSITNTGTAGTYGSASNVPVFVTNSQGQVTSVTNTAISISAGSVSGLAASATTDTTNAANITAGTLNSARLTGSYTGITGVGTLTAGTWNGTVIGATYGGTGQSAYAVGDLLYANTTTSLAKLPDVATGNVLLSGGVGTAPAWGQVGLSTHVSGTLQVGNGGTGATTLTGYVKGNGTSAFTAAATIPNADTTATSTNTAYAIVARDVAGNFSANTITANLDGNATTATTAANVNNGALTLAVAGTGLSGSASFTANQSGNVTFTVTSNATSANTASTIVARDASGNFIANTITATLAGNASTATSATSAGVSTNLAGGVAGAVPYQSGAGTTGFSAAGSSGQYLQSNGTSAPSWVTPPTIGNGTLTMNTSGTGLSGTATFTANQTGASTFTVASNATSANTASTIVARDASGNFSAGTITAALSGNASTATTATTATTANALNTGNSYTGTAFTASSTDGYFYANRAAIANQAGIQFQTAGTTNWWNYLDNNTNTLAWYQSGTSTQVMTLTQAGTLNVVGNITLGGSQVLTAGNYSSYLNNTYLRAIGYASSSNDWNSLGNSYPNTVEQVDPTNFSGTANGPTSAAYTYGLLVNFSAQSSAQAQMYISHNGNDLIFRGGWGGSSWQTWNRVLTNQNYNSYSPTLTGGGASGTWGINISGSSGGANAVNNVGYGDGTFTWYQSSGNWQTWTGGWASHLISNHGNGSTYYNQTIIMPFWGPPQYMRKEGGTNVGPYVFLTTENYTSYSPSLTGGGASGTWGINISGNAATATSATSATTATNWGSYGAVPAAGTSFGNANTIGRSDANGYTYFNYINSNTGNGENGTVSQVIITNGTDNFYRKATIAHLTSNLSGTAPINISGNAATATTATTATTANALNTANSYTVTGFTVAPAAGTNGRIQLTTATNSTTSSTGITALKSGYVPTTTAAVNTVWTLLATALDSSSVTQTYCNLSFRQRVVTGGALRGRTDLVSTDGSSTLGAYYAGYFPLAASASVDTYGLGMTTGESIQIQHGQNLEFTNLGIGSTPYARFDSTGLFFANNGTGSTIRGFFARAWVNFNGTGTVAIRASGNVSSITDNGTGDYTVNFTTAMPDANYGTHIDGSNSASNSVTVGYLRWNTTAPTTSAARIGTTNDAGTSFDVPYVCVTIFR